MKNPVPVSRNVYDSLASIFRASRFSGICPLRIVRNANGFNLVWSSKMLAYSYVSVVILVCGSIYGLVQNYRIREVRNIRLKTIAGMVCTLSENVTLLISCLLGSTLTPFYQRHLWKYLKCLYQADTLLGVKDLNQGKKCSVVMYITLTITVLILVLDLTLWCRVAVRSTPLVIYVGSAIPFYITYVFQMITELHFWMLVHLLKVRLRSLNEDLAALLQEVEICSGFLENNEYMSKKLVEVVRHCGDVKSDYYEGKNVVTGEKISKRVKNIISIHSLLTEACTAANDYFGINVLVLLLGCLMHLLITPYVLLMEINETRNRVFIGSQLIWLACHISRLIFIIEPCQACKCQVQITVNLACKLLRFEICEDAKSQLQLLLVQLDRCRIQFTACNLVTIDRTLLTTVTGTVTTYLVILFQFQQAENGL